MKSRGTKPKIFRCIFFTVEKKLNDFTSNEKISTRFILFRHLSKIDRFCFIRNFVLALIHANWRNLAEWSSSLTTFLGYGFEYQQGQKEIILWTLVTERQILYNAHMTSIRRGTFLLCLAGDRSALLPVQVFIASTLVAI